MNRDATDTRALIERLEQQEERIRGVLNEVRNRIWNNISSTTPVDTESDSDSDDSSSDESIIAYTSFPIHFSTNTKVGDIVSAILQGWSRADCRVVSIRNTPHNQPMSKMVTLRYIGLDSYYCQDQTMQLHYGDEFIFELEANPQKNTSRRKRKYINSEMEAKIDAYTDPCVAALCETTNARVLRNRAIFIQVERE